MPVRRRTPKPSPRNALLEGRFSITGPQLRAVMDHLGWSEEDFAKRFDLPPEWVSSVIDRDGLVLAPNEERIRAVLGEHGVIILPPMPGDLGVRYLPD